MPESETIGKDKIIFTTKEDFTTPSTIVLPELEQPPGLILDDGSINWSCPCLGGMATGPCGVQFREAFSCFHYSTAETKGSDCIEAFTVMQTCMQKYPTLYGPGEDEEELKYSIDKKPKKEEIAASATSQSP